MGPIFFFFLLLVSNTQCNILYKRFINRNFHSIQTIIVIHNAIKPCDKTKLLTITTQVHIAIYLFNNYTEIKNSESAAEHNALIYICSSSV